MVRECKGDRLEYGLDKFALLGLILTYLGNDQASHAMTDEYKGSLSTVLSR